MTAEYSISFAELLQRFRRDAGLTQDELADRARLSPGTISDLERGVYRAPRRTTVALLADALRLNASDRHLFESAIRRARNATSLPSLRPSSMLPAPLTRLIGREVEIGAISRLVLADHVRLVTLTGMAGIGKTRLALAIASQISPYFADGVYFVSLATIQDRDLIPESIAQVLNVQETSDHSLIDLIAAFLSSKRALLILDNFEHLLDGVALVVDLLAGCPHLVILVTSRTALRVRGEQRFAVPPLDCAAEHSAAEDLFIERAREVHPLLPLTPANLTSVAAICRRVDGIPLAIELAAMRVATFAPPELLRHLDHRLPVLIAGARDLPRRQQTMRDAIAWSYDLLSLQDQPVFRRLAIFVGGWTFATASALCGEMDDQGDLLMTLSSLVDTNLIQQEPAEDGGETRFTMLEILREYGLEQLAFHGELESMRRCHAEYMLTLAEQANASLRGPDQARWLACLEQEHGNLRAALHWSKEHDPRVGLLLSAALWRFWYARRHLSEGRSWLEHFLAQDLVEMQPVQAQIAFGASVLAVEQEDRKQAKHLTEAGFHLFQEIGDVIGMCSVLNVQGHLASQEDHYQQAEEYYRQALSLCRSLDHSGWIATILNNFAVIVTAQGHYSEALALLEESLTRQREHGHQLGIAANLLNLSDLFYMQERYIQAGAFAKESLLHAKQTGDDKVIAAALDHVGKAAIGQGDYQQALAALEESRQIYEEIDDVHGTAEVLQHFGDLAREQREWQQTEAYYAASIQADQQSGTQLSIAGCLANWARALLARGRIEQAAAFASKSVAIFESIGISPYVNLSVRLEQTKRAIQKALGDETFQVAWDRGKTLSLADLQHGSAEISPLATPEMNGQQQPQYD